MFRADAQTERRRFLGLWAMWAGLYALLAVLGPNGLVPEPVWPVVSQHVLQARAWLGRDIDVVDDNGAVTGRVAVSPRLDVTPYFRHRIVRDPREEALVGNLAVAIRTASGSLEPVQEARLGAAVALLAEDLQCFVGFPPGPAVVLLPFEAAVRGGVPTQWLAVLLGGLAVAALDLLLGGLVEATGVAAGPVRNRLVVLAGAGTLWLWVVPDGGTFLFAQTVGTTALTVALALVHRGWRWSGGLALGLALISRPAMVGVLPLVAALELAAPAPGGGGPVRRLARIAVGPALAGGAAMVLNLLRFDSPWDFGYRFMLVPPFLRERLVEHGQLASAYLGRNLQWVGFQPPVVVRDAAGAWSFPWLASDPQGMGLLFVTPAFIALFAALWARPGRPAALLAACWLSLVLVCLPGLLYYSTGWVQWGGRFLVDAWPLWLVLAGVGLARTPDRLGRLLVALSVAANAWAALLTATRVWPGCCN